MWRSRERICRPLEQPLIAEAEVALGRQDHVVEQRDSEEPPRIRQALSSLLVLPAGVGVPGRVIVLCEASGYVK